MAVDYQKTKVRYVNPNIWLNHSLLDFKREASEKTGLLENTSRAKYFNLDFLICYNEKKPDQVNSMWVQGSLHKYSNFLKGINAPNQYNDELKAKGFNGNDFSYNDFLNVLNDLEARFSINFEHSTLHHLEYGVNIRHNLKTSAILDGLILHNSGFFNTERNKYKYLRQAKKDQLVVKVYDKALQYGLFHPVLRFEMKARKMEFIKDMNIKSLNDLRNIARWDLLLNDLLKCWDNILFIDHLMNKSKLNQKEQTRFKDYSNILFWENTNPNHRDRPKKRYKEIQRKCEGKTHETIKHGIMQAYSDLVACVRIDSSSNKSNITQLRILNTHFGLVG